MKESPIFGRSYDLLRWLIPATTKFPRQHRFVLATAVQRTAFDVHESLIEASYGDDAEARLAAADVALAKLRMYLRLSHDLGLVSTAQLAHVSAMVDEVGRLLGGWRKALRARSRGQRHPEAG